MCISLVHEPDKPWSIQKQSCTTHEKNSGDAVHRLGTIIQSIFCAQSEANNCLTIWKWSGESWYPGAFSLVLENFCRAFSAGLADRLWVSNDVFKVAQNQLQISRQKTNTLTFYATKSTKWYLKITILQSVQVNFAFGAHINSIEKINCSSKIGAIYP